MTSKHRKVIAKLQMDWCQIDQILIVIHTWHSYSITESSTASVCSVVFHFVAQCILFLSSVEYLVISLLTMLLILILGARQIWNRKNTGT